MMYALSSWYNLKTDPMVNQAPMLSVHFWTHSRPSLAQSQPVEIKPSLLAGQTMLTKRRSKNGRKRVSRMYNRRWNESSRRSLAKSMKGWWERLGYPPTKRAANVFDLYSALPSADKTLPTNLNWSHLSLIFLRSINLISIPLSEVYRHSGRL